MSNLFEHCRGAKEVEIIKAQIVRGVFCLYTFEYGESYPPLQNGLNLQKIVQWINTGGLKQKT